jgi:hypothetical protein
MGHATKPLAGDMHNGQTYDHVKEWRGSAFVHLFVMSCSTCSFTDRIHLQDSISPAGVHQKLRKRGWLTNERKRAKCFCPICATKPKEKTTVNANVTITPKSELAARQSPAPVVDRVELSSAAMQQLLREPTMFEIRRIIEAVGIYFDETEGRYTKGYSDQKIGEELNLPWAMVQKVRDQSGYKLKIDPEVAKLSSDIATVKEMLADLERRHSTLTKRLGA